MFKNKDLVENVLVNLEMKEVENLCRSIKILDNIVMINVYG
jgi:hypothetical protein